MKLGLYQGPSPQGDVADALRRVETILSAAALAGASMVVFPELFLPGYNQMQAHHSLAQLQGGAWEQQFSRLASKANCGLCIGWAERADGKTYNAASCFDASGQKIGHYRKQHPYGPTEKSVFVAGDRDCIFEFNGKKTAILICYDVEFAQRVRTLHEQGVELLLVPTANPIAFDVVSDTLVPARAFESRMTIAYANYSGTEAGLTYGGKSIIVGPDAEILAQAGVGETILITDISVIKQIDPTILSTQQEDAKHAKATALSATHK